MPEIGRPPSPQEMQYRQVTMGPQSLSGKKELSEAEIKEKIIQKATGSKPKNEVFQQGPHNQMGKDEFLKLLTFQLQNQDPMNPMEQSKFTGELAQFSQLEQLSNLNKKFEEVNKSQQMQDKFYAASFVGKKVVTSGSSLDLKNDGDSQDVLFKLDSDASKVLIRIMDEKNQTMGEIWKEGMSQGAHNVTWDGVALDGTPAVKGKYTVMIKAWDRLGGEVSAKTQATGLVQAVNFEDNEPVLTVDGQKVYLRDVVSFHLPTMQGATNSGLQQMPPMPVESKKAPMMEALNAYKENDKGIYD